MSLAARLVELPQRLAWKRGQAMTPLYQRAFRAWGAGSVMVSPLKLQGVERISVGAGCSFWNDVWLGTERGASLDIGDRVYIGHRSHLHSASEVVIGHGTMITDDVIISDGAHDMGNAGAVVPGGRIVIGRSVFIGQGVAVLGGVTIGDGAVVGAHAVVTRDVPAGGVVAGVPARPVRGSAPRPDNNSEETA